MITLLLQLLLAHLVGDFLLQPNKWVANKERYKIKSPALYGHIALHIALILLITWDDQLLVPALILGAIHAGIDLMKLYFQTKKSGRAWFFIDQSLHFISIVLLWCWLQPEAREWIYGFFNSTNLLYLLAYLFITVPAAIIIKMIISRWQPDVDIKLSRRSETPGSYHPLDATKGAKTPQSLQDGGKYIGILERTFILTFILVGHWEAIGFLLAAKSIFRFSDLKQSKDRKLTEYIIIGTFVSVGLAMATGLLVQHVLKLM